MPQRPSLFQGLLEHPSCWRSLRKVHPEHKKFARRTQLPVAELVLWESCSAARKAACSSTAKKWTAQSLRPARKKKADRTLQPGEG